MVKQTIEGKTFEVIYYGTSYENAKKYGTEHHHPLEFFVTLDDIVGTRLHQLWARALVVDEKTIHRVDLE